MDMKRNSQPYSQLIQPCVNKQSIFVYIMCTFSCLGFMSCAGVVDARQENNMSI